ncbi:hypothetical protein [Phenylobacterium sp.]|jgi:hypothetical protein|uniref:hypothetical protein n=1 Tax=Phenylobacterium sp. TaxID=1871053 RepID=UPI002F94734F
MTPMLLALALLAQDPSAAEATKPAVAAPPVAEAAAATPTKAKKVGNDDETFCRNEAPMGTRIPKKRCYNKQEFKMRQLDERKNLDRIQADARAPVIR